MLVQNGSFLTKIYGKRIRNYSNEVILMISNVHGNKMAPTFSHLSLPIRTNENAIKISKL
jgi:hypothetical protein